jgi:hypothetical protein
MVGRLIKLLEPQAQGKGLQEVLRLPQNLTENRPLTEYIAKKIKIQVKVPQGGSDKAMETTKQNNNNNKKIKKARYHVLKISNFLFLPILIIN